MIKTDNWIHYVRMKEISQILPYLDKEFKILEIGSGDGYIAKYLNDIGYNVVATDLNPRIPSYYNIKKLIDFISRLRVLVVFLKKASHE
jgi:uncharacterized UPF0146 family protein